MTFIVLKMSVWITSFNLLQFERLTATTPKQFQKLHSNKCCPTGGVPVEADEGVYITSPRIHHLTGQWSPMETQGWEKEGKAVQTMGTWPKSTPWSQQGEEERS